MRPSEFARLTDYQIIHVYLLPEQRRQEEMEKRRQGATAPAAESEGRTPSKQEMYWVWMQMGGWTKEMCDKEYTRLLKIDRDKNSR